MAYRRTANVEARLAEARERLVQAALRVVGRAGWGAATVATIARQAGVSVGTVYHHFPGKDELVAETFRRAAGLELARVAEAAESAGPPLARLEASLRTFAERAWRGRRLAYALLAEPASPSVEAERLTYRVEYQAVFRALLEEAIVDGSLSPHDSNLLAAALTGAMAEALVGPLSPAGERRRERSSLIDDLVAICLRALPTPDPSPRTEPP